jgi:hypothetical protein
MSRGGQTAFYTYVPTLLNGAPQYSVAATFGNHNSGRAVAFLEYGGANSRVAKSATTIESIADTVRYGGRRQLRR